MQTAASVLQDFYGAISRRDLSAARSYLADDMIYHGIFRTFHGADAYLAMFQSFLSFTERLDIKVVLSNGDDAAIFYEMKTTKPAPAVTFVGEWHQIRDGRIVAARAACDGRPFVSLFPDSGVH